MNAGSAPERIGEAHLPCVPKLDRILTDDEVRRELDVTARMPPAVPTGGSIQRKTLRSSTSRRRRARPLVLPQKINALVYQAIVD